MTNKEAIELFKDIEVLVFRDVKQKYFHEDIEDAFKIAIEALEQEPRWIPTSERYPRPDDEYKFFLVTDDKGRVSVQEFYLSLDEEPQPYFSGMVNVIAWMPLPEPYKAESEE